MILLENFNKEFQEKLQRKLLLNYIFAKIKKYKCCQSLDSILYYVEKLADSKTIRPAFVGITFSKLKKECDYFVFLNKKNEELAKTNQKHYDSKLLALAETKYIEQYAKRAIKMLKKQSEVEEDEFDLSSNAQDAIYAKMGITEWQSLLDFIAKKEKSAKKSDFVCK